MTPSVTSVESSEQFWRICEPWIQMTWQNVQAQSRIWQAYFWLDISWHLTNKQLCSMKDTPFNLISCCRLIFCALSTCTVEPPLLGHLSTTVTLFHSSKQIYSYLNLSPTATSLQGQRPLRHVHNGENNLSTTANFFQWLMKKSRMDIRTAHLWSIAAIAFWFCFIYAAVAVSINCLRYLQRKLRTLLLVTLTFWFKT